MTIGRKVGIGFGVALALLAGGGALAYWSTSRFIAANDATARAEDTLADLQRLLFLVQDAETSQRGYLLTHDESFLDELRNATGETESVLDRLRHAAGTDADRRQHIDELDRTVHNRLQVIQEGLDVAKTGQGVAGAANVIKSRSKAAMQRVRTQIEQLKAEERKLVDERRDAAAATGRVTRSAFGIGIPVAVLVLAGAAYMAVRSITGPLRRLRDATRKLAQGALDYRVNIDSRDEVGELAREFDRMAGRRQQAVEAIRGAVNRLTTASTQIMASTTQQAAGAQEQAAAVAQTVATVDEVTQTAAQAVERAKGVGEAVQRTQEVGKAGRRAVEDAVAALGGLKDRIEATAESILALAEQAQAIGEIIATVTDIAEQTNLLALNAAIEASRAGEHGKGFSVVAGEVKQLADQAKKATAQVRQILGEIQKATNAAVLSTEEVTKGVAATIQVSGQSGEAITSLAETLADAARATGQIMASARQQATGMAQIGQAMKNLDQVAQQHLVATRQVEQAAQNLNALGTELASLSGQ